MLSLGRRRSPISVVPRDAGRLSCCTRLCDSQLSRDFEALRSKQKIAIVIDRTDNPIVRCTLDALRKKTLPHELMLS